MTGQPEGDEFLPSVNIYELESVTWPILYVYNGGVGVQFVGLLVDDDGFVWVYDNTAGAFRSISPTQVIVNTAGLGPTLFSDVLWSNTRKFYLEPFFAAANTFAVLRHGIPVYQRSINLDNADAAAVIYASMSANGKFIAFIVRSTATGNNRYMMLYKGI